MGWGTGAEYDLFYSPRMVVAKSVLTQVNAAATLANTNKQRQYCYPEIPLRPYSQKQPNTLAYACDAATLVRLTCRSLQFVPRCFDALRLLSMTF